MPRAIVCRVLVVRFTHKRTEVGCSPPDRHVRLTAGERVCSDNRAEAFTIAPLVTAARVVQAVLVILINVHECSARLKDFSEKNVATLFGPWHPMRFQLARTLLYFGQISALRRSLPAVSELQ